jgi:predicted transcriptional regulator
MPTSILLSIKPKFAEAILEGTKIFELRRTIFRGQDVQRIVIYASRPVSRVVGECRIDNVLALEPTKLWSLTSFGAGVDRDFFDAYFHGKKIGFALKVSKPKRYAKARRLDEHCGLSRPPQSFCYLNSHQYDRSMPSKKKFHRGEDSDAALGILTPLMLGVS